MTALWIIFGLCVGFVVGAAYEATRKNGSQDLAARIRFLTHGPWGM